MRDARRRPRLPTLLFAASALLALTAGFAACGSTGASPSDDAGSSAPHSVNDAGLDVTLPADSSATDSTVTATDAADAPHTNDGAAGFSADAGIDAAPVATTPQPLLDGAAFYPRAIALEDGTIVASVVAPQASGRLGATVLASKDDGVTFAIVGNVDDTRAQGGLCCGTLYVLPRALGALGAGTLFWAASVGGDQTATPMSIPIWSSADNGKTWNYLSTAVVASVAHSGANGLWEPEFSMLDDGTLVCHFSDETDSAHSQKLAAVRTSDGIAWTQREDTVALSASGARPGMANVRRPSGGSFVMSYEVCGEGTDNCAAHVRMSADGWNWGDATDIGLRPATVDGKHFLHAPTLAWTASPGTFGRFFLMGQVATEDGGNAPENGNLLLANAESGNQFWYALSAPSPVTAPYDNYCPNYSSPVLPLDDGTFALELSSRYDGTTCRTYFARGPVTGTRDATGLSDGATYRFVSTMSGLCLDVADGSVDAGGNVQQWTCNDLSPQNWTLKRAADGTFSLKAQNSGMCLARTGGATAAGTNVEQDPCNGSASQAWGARNVGTGYFVFQVPGSAGTCLDVAGGSTSAGGNIQVWTCNDLAPQTWLAEAE